MCQSSTIFCITTITTKNLLNIIAFGLKRVFCYKRARAYRKEKEKPLTYIQILYKILTNTIKFTTTIRNILYSCKDILYSKTRMGSFDYSLNIFINFCLY